MRNPQGLSTPPCSEGVHWMVLTQPVKVSAEGIRRFRQLYPATAGRRLPCRYLSAPAK